MDSPDIALLRLESPVEGATIATIADAAPQTGDTCLVVGYGRHNADNDINANEFQTEEWTYNEQRAAHVRVTTINSEVAFSAQGIDGAHSSGDSGGPIFCGDKVAGIVSCTPNDDARVLALTKVYAPVEVARSFIEETLVHWSYGR